MSDQISPLEPSANDGFFNVVLLNDDDHTHEYVICLLDHVFGYHHGIALALAKEVDQTGRTVVMMTSYGDAQDRVAKITNFGPDRTISHCTGSMAAVIEPAAADVMGPALRWIAVPFWYFEKFDLSRQLNPAPPQISTPTKTSKRKKKRKRRTIDLSTRRVMALGFCVLTAIALAFYLVIQMMNTD